MFLFLNVKKKIEDLDLKWMLQTLGIVDLFFKKIADWKISFVYNLYWYIEPMRTKTWQEPCLPNNELWSPYNVNNFTIDIQI